MSLLRRSVALDDGVELWVEVTGSGPPIVLLHGFTGDASTMRVLTERLAVDHTVVVPNLIGHGASTGPAGNYSVDAMAEQVLAALDRIGHGAPYDIVGYSMGGRVALTMACRFPGQVASLSLIGASAGLSTEDERAEREAADARLAASILADGLDAFVDSWMANPLFATQSRLGDEFLAAARDQRLQNSPEELAKSLRGAGTGTMQPLHGLLDRCLMPIALIVGSDDSKFREIAGGLAPAMPDAEVVVIEGAGHAAHLEQPDAVVEAIRGAEARGSVRVTLLSLALRSAHSTGRGTAIRRESVLVGLRSGGRTGWGEASPLPGWSVDSLDDAAASLREQQRFELTRSAWDDTTAWRDSLAEAPASRAAVAGAALDLDARLHGVPLHRYLAQWHPGLDESAVAETLEVNALVSAIEPDDVGRRIGAYVAAGFRTVKLKVGAVSPEVDIARIDAARAAGPHVDIRLDANGAWDHDTALAVLAHAAAVGVVLCEEPVRGIEEIAALGRLAAVPVAVDESLRSPSDLDRVIAHADGLAALVVKPQALGGPDLAIELILTARGVGLEVIVTSMIDSAVGLAHAAHVAAACGLGSAHGLATAGMLQTDVAPGLPVIGGRIAMPEVVGLGIGLVSPGALDAS